MRFLPIGGRMPSTVEVAASPPPEPFGPQLPLQLHQAPHLGAVSADIWLDVDGHLADGGQVNAEQLCAPLQWRRDRPAQVRVVPGPHRNRVSNTSSRANRERCLVRRWGRSPPEWAGAATRRSLGDSKGQQETINVEVSSGFAAIHLGSETPEPRFHTAAATRSGLGCEGWTIATAKPVCGRQHQRPVWGTNRLMAAEFKPRGGGGGLIQSGGGFWRAVAVHGRVGGGVVGW
jgi:hypothetical protein